MTLSGYHFSAEFHDIVSLCLTIIKCLKYKHKKKLINSHFSMHTSMSFVAILT